MFCLSVTIFYDKLFVFTHFASYSTIALKIMMVLMVVGMMTVMTVAMRMRRVMMVMVIMILTMMMKGECKKEKWSTRYKSAPRKEYKMIWFYTLFQGRVG